ncbi:MAG TPA: response regulator transcription factor [Negativicutes bacterium]
MRILLVENDRCLQEMVSHILREEGYIINSATNDSIALEMAYAGEYDTILLDLDNALLSNRDEISLLKEFNNINSETSFILLATSSVPSDWWKFLSAGTTDFLVKPFLVNDLLALLKLLAYRKPAKSASEKLEVSGLILEPLSGQVRKGVKTITLTVKETSILELLMRNCGLVLSKEHIIRKVWGHYSDITATNVSLYIFYLRRKLGYQHIETVRGFGYCFKG